MSIYDEWKKEKEEKKESIYEQWKKERNVETENIKEDKKGFDIGNLFSIGTKEAFEKIKNPEARNVEDKRKWFQPGVFEDGYQFGDITKAISGSGADIGQDLTSGVLGIGEGLADTTAYLVGLKAKWRADYLKSLDKTNMTE